jgi:hypothetical protein
MLPSHGCRAGRGGSARLQLQRAGGANVASVAMGAPDQPLTLGLQSRPIRCAQGKL